MKLSNLDLLCSVPLTQMSGIKHATGLEEGVSPFQALFMELQIPYQSGTPETLEDEVQDETKIEVEQELDLAPVSVDLSHSKVPETEQGQIDVKPLINPIPLPNHFIELPRRPIPIIDLPKLPSQALTVPLFVRSERFEGDGLRKNTQLLTTAPDLEKLEFYPDEKPYIQQVKSEIEGPLESVESTNEIRIPEQQQSKPGTLPQGLSVLEIRVPEDVPETPFLRQELPRVLMAPIRQLVSTEGGMFRIQLFPEHLGHIELMVSVEEGQVTASLTTSSHLAKEVLETQLPQLRQQLIEQGVAMESLEVEWRDSRDAPERQANQQQSESHKQRSSMESNQQEPSESESEQDDGFDFSV